MNIIDLLEDVLEESIRASGLKIGFKQIIPSENYVDSLSSLPVFGTKWGRGVLVSSNGKLDAIVGGYGSSHAELKKQMEAEESSAGSFYYGFDAKTGTLYLDYATDRTFTFDNKVLGAIINALKNSSGYFRGMIIGK